METDIGFLIFQIKQLSDRLFNRLLAEKGLAQYNGAQGRILISLWNEGPKSIRDLSKGLSLAPTTLTAMLDHLEKQGLIERTRQAKDRRIILEKTTEKSLAHKADYLAIESEINRRILAGFSSKESSRLQDDLLQLKDNIQHQGEQR